MAPHSLEVGRRNNIKYGTSDGNKQMIDDTSVNILQKRSSGILLPVFSLPGASGIGDIGHPAYGNLLIF